MLALSVHSLQQELARYDPQEILDSLTAIGDRQLSYALGFTILSCFAISCYDLIAFNCFKYKLCKNKILFLEEENLLSINLKFLRFPQIK